MRNYPLLDIYEPQCPELLTAAARTAPMVRLAQVGMNCGCEYTAYPRFARCGGYSRYLHSVGAARIVWHFTRDPAQAMAALLHDIATPPFAHVIDFLRGDYLTQEATEDGTAEIIAASPELQAVLHRAGLTTADVCDYHRYPIADNDTPRLCADRLEYTLGNLYFFALRPVEEIRRFYDDLTVLTGEDGTPEPGFRHAGIALDFANAAMECAEIYVADTDRYVMQMLSELIGDALHAGVLTEQDLRGTEPPLIEKLTAHPAFARRWQDFRALGRIETSPVDRGGAWRRIYAKKRYIDPLTAEGRCSALDDAFAARLREFRGRPQDYWVRGAAL